MTPEQIATAQALIKIARILDNANITGPHMFYRFSKSSHELAECLEQALNALETSQSQAREAGYSAGAKETKERILIAIKMAGGMAEQFGNPIKADTLAHIYVLIEAMPVDVPGPAGIE